MKIYQKKRFAWGIFCIALALLNITACIMTKDLRVKSILIAVFLCIVGYSELRHGLSARLSAEDKAEEEDPRSRLVELRTQKTSFQLMQTFCIVFQTAFLVAGAFWEKRELMFAGLAFSGLFLFSMVIELCACLYYERKIPKEEGAER